MRLVPDGGSIDSLACRKSGSSARAFVDHRERLRRVFGQDIGRRFEQSSRLLGQNEHAVARGPIEGEDQITSGECGVDRDPRLHSEWQRYCGGDIPARKQPQALERMLPVHLIDELVQVLDQVGDVPLLELVMKAFQSLGHEVLDDDAIALVRRRSSVCGSQYRNRGVILMFLKALQFATADHGRLNSIANKKLYGSLPE